MDKFARAFVREKPGVRYVRGEKLCGSYDVAEWLDTIAATGHGPRNIDFL